MTIEQIKHQNYKSGFYFFDSETMRFFKSRVLSHVFQGPGGIYFVTSEVPPREGRQYKPRRFNPDTGRVMNVEGYAWTSKYLALKQAQHLAETVPTT